MIGTVLSIIEPVHQLVLLENFNVFFRCCQNKLYKHNINSIGFQTIYYFQGNKKVEGQPRPFYSSEISKWSEILY